ncbi:MAG TPA: helical backbone metal receptor [Bryobacteraceae bacterium]|nr:helical backbone metal receptor [Bryobacteraceae bacterium]HOQ44935.1 helical backbone metal receptor [Bryobacteraceae bacterium]HPQ13991.1 helical backbone metal receptor [Bryobacteraceae bacterium]HPU72055.1 helical backbone metal receptor [Bryobacteraceae bacterium]
MVRRLFCVLLAPVVLLAAGPARIVSTSPSITEMLYAMGLGDRVAGVTTFCRYPPEAARKPKIGNYLQPNMEIITALRPDLVIAEVTGVRRAERFSVLGLRVLEVDDGTIAGIYDSISRIGEAAGAKAAADALNARIRASLEEVRRKTEKLPRRRVVFVVGRAPGRLAELVVAGKGSYLDEVMTLAGGKNIFGDTLAQYSKVSLEELLARNPEVIVDMGEMADTAGVTEQEKRAVVALWRRYPSLAAVQNGRVFAVASDVFVVPGPRVVDAAREFARMLHPEAGF